MPSEWDGIETVVHLWKKDPNLEVVFCTAFSDHSWHEMAQLLGEDNHRWLILKKPFEVMEILQVTHSLTTKWQLLQDKSHEINSANEIVAALTKEQQELESELRLAQKLEAIGQLAAGIAHEINTPIQYIGDSVTFLKSAFEDISNALAQYDDEIDKIGLKGQSKEVFATIKEETDLEYLKEEIPSAIECSIDGLRKTADIVRAMKKFSHHNEQDDLVNNLNHELETVLTVAASEYKNQAKIIKKWGELSPVVCNRGEISQVFLNLIINSAHVIGDKFNQTGEMGEITIETVQEGDDIVITVEDTGSGISEEHLDRIFDPFFTTKEVGVGTGQGLALAHKIIVNNHKGSIDYISQKNIGTKFTIKLPLKK